MLVVTLNAVVKCSHDGIVHNTHTQDWVTVRQPSSRDRGAREPMPVLIEPDPERRSIVGCPNINVGIWPCLNTLTVRDGYSTFVRIGGKRMCLKSVTGPTDGSPGTHTYTVRSAGQAFVECSE